MKKRLLFWCGSLSSLSVLLQVAAGASARYEPIFLVGDAAGVSKTAITALVQKHGFLAWVDSPVTEQGKRKIPGWPPSDTLRSVVMSLAILYLERRTGPNPYAKIVRAQVRNAESILAAINPSAVVLSEDGISGPLDLLTAVRRRRIPLIDVPFGFGVRRDLELDLARKMETGDAHWATGPYAAWIRFLAPEWISCGAVSGALPFAPAYIAGLIAAGVKLRDPWIIHGGLSDRLCAESKKGMALYRSEGVPAGKIRLTGSPYCDVMADALAADDEARAAFRQPRPIVGGELRILVSWPPSYHDTRPGVNEFATYAEMTSTVLGFLRRLPGCSVTVSLHPAVDASTRRQIEAEGIAVTDEYVIRAIPRHDIYVTYFSSTIRWALAAGKPVVNYDAYRLGLEVYDAGGFVTEPTFAAFCSRMSDLVTSTEAFRAAAQANIDVADDWGIVDGQATARIVSLLDELTS